MSFVISSLAKYIERESAQGLDVLSSGFHGGAITASIQQWRRWSGKHWGATKGDIKEPLIHSHRYQGRGRIFNALYSPFSGNYALGSISYF